MKFTIDQIMEFMEEALEDEEWEEFLKWNKALKKKGLPLNVALERSAHYQDMIPAMIRTLKLVWSEHDEIDQMVKDLYIQRRAYDNPWWNSDKACHAKERLMELLNEHAPPGYYFGPCPEDESLLGYWRDDYEG